MYTECCVTSYHQRIGRAKMKIEKKVIRLFDKGTVPADIAKQLGIPASKVYAILKATFEPQATEATNDQPAA
jgi:DNA-binding GntR family transcriptional regulator